jgi:hypothetical protein
MLLILFSYDFGHANIDQLAGGGGGGGVTVNFGIVTWVRVRITKAK